MLTGAGRFSLSVRAVGNKTPYELEPGPAGAAREELAARPEEEEPLELEQRACAWLRDLQGEEIELRGTHPTTSVVLLQLDS